MSDTTAALPAPAGHPTPTPADMALIRSATAQIIFSLIGAWAAIDTALPPECLICRPTHPVLQEFLRPQGWGTAMSPPLLTILLTLAATALLRAKRGPLNLWRGALALTGVLFTARQLAEPYTWVALLEPAAYSHLHQLVMVTFIAGAATLGVLGVRALIAGRR